MQFDRRSFLAGGLGAGLAGLSSAYTLPGKAKDGSSKPDVRDLDKAATLPVLKTDTLSSPVIIESIKLLKKDRDYFVRVRSKDGAEGVYAAALEDGGAVALKIQDGAARARPPVLVEALRSLGVSGLVLDDLSTEPVLGGGREVGHVRAAFRA